MLHFRHQGLTPDLECYDMCDAGWTYYLGSLVSYVELSQIHDHGRQLRVHQDRRGPSR